MVEVEFWSDDPELGSIKDVEIVSTLVLEAKLVICVALK